MKDERYSYVERKCPICGKVFIPAAYHVYRKGERGPLVCSWGCQRAYEKEREEYRRRSKERANEKRRLKRESKNTASAIVATAEGT